MIRDLTNILKPVTFSIASLAFFRAILADSLLKYLWGLINTAQIIAVAPLINVLIPSNVMIVFRFLAIANGDW